MKKHRKVKTGCTFYWLHASIHVNDIEKYMRVLREVFPALICNKALAANVASFLATDQYVDSLKGHRF